MQLLARVMLAALALAAACSRSALPDDAAGEGGSGGTSAPACAAQPWIRALGGHAFAYAPSVSTNAQGRVVVAGAYAGELFVAGDTTLDGGEDGFFLVSFDACGEVEWARRMGRANNVGALNSRVALGADGSAIFAGVVGDEDIDLGKGPLPSGGGFDALVVKLDPKGEVLWARRFGDSYDQVPQQVAVRPDGRINLAGAFGGALGAADLVGGDGPDMFMIELSPEGDVSWGYQLGTNSEARSMAYDIDGSILTAVTYGGVLPFPVDQAPYEAGIALLRIDAGSGSLVRIFGGPGSHDIAGIAVDPETGHVTVAGVFIGHIEGEIVPGSTFVADSYDGNWVDAFYLQWSRDGSQHGSGTSVNPGSEWISGLAPAPGGRALMAGSFAQKFDLPPLSAQNERGVELFIAQLSSDLSGEKLISTGGPAYGDATSVVSTPDGAVCFAGRFEGTIDFGFGSLTAAGPSEVFVARLPKGL